MPNSKVDTQNNTVSIEISGFSYFILMGAGFEPDYEKVVVYPNPYYANKHDGMYFDRLTRDSVIRIYTIAGELVREITVKDFPQKWDVRNEAGEDVTSGIYLYLIKDPAGNKKTGRLGVIR
ncbi:T9SS type A sorting domain-containing protein [Candidatus Desantisbacteria bacterium]|nr:T9SS type A sorting domain-containing protein [Candidatus Desantisbacteria bacterium]